MNKIKCDKSTGAIHSKYTFLRNSLCNTCTGTILILLIMNFYKEKLS